MVSEGEDLMTFRVYDPSIAHPKKNPNGRFPPSYPSPEFNADPVKKGNEKLKIEEAMSHFDGEWIDDVTDDEAEEDLEDATLGRLHALEIHDYYSMMSFLLMSCEWSTHLDNAASYHVPVTFFFCTVLCHSLFRSLARNVTLPFCLRCQMSFGQTGAKSPSGLGTAETSSRRNPSSWWSKLPAQVSSSAWISAVDVFECWGVDFHPPICILMAPC